MGSIALCSLPFRHFLVIVVLACVERVLPVVQPPRLRVTVPLVRFSQADDDADGRIGGMPHFVARLQGVPRVECQSSHLSMMTTLMPGLSPQYFRKIKHPTCASSSMNRSATSRSTKPFAKLSRSGRDVCGIRPRAMFAFFSDFRHGHVITISTRVGPAIGCVGRCPIKIESYVAFACSCAFDLKTTPVLWLNLFACAVDVGGTQDSKN